MPTSLRLQELVERFSGELKLSRYVIKDAVHIAEKLVKDKLGAGYAYAEIALVSLYIACRKGSVPISLRELSMKFNVNQQRLSRLYRKVVTAYGLRLPSVKPEDYLVKRVIPWIESRGVVITGDDVTRALEILLKAREKNPVLNAKAAATAALYIALGERGLTPNEELFARTANISTVTLRKYVKILKTLLFR